MITFLKQTYDSDIELELFDKVGLEGFIHRGTPLIKESDVSFDAAINEGYNSEVVDAVTTDYIQEEVHHEKMKVEQHDEVHMESFNHCGRPLIKEADISINEATLDEGGIEEINQTISVDHIPEETHNSDIELELFDKFGVEGFIHCGTPLIKESDVSFDAAINEGYNSEVVHAVETDNIQEEVHHEKMKVEQHDEVRMESFNHCGRPLIKEADISINEATLDEGGIEEIIETISVDHIPELTYNSDIELELFHKVGLEGFIHRGTPLIKESDVSFDAAINEGYNSEVVHAVTTDYIQEEVSHEKMKVEQHDEVHMESFNHCGRPLIKEADISINEATLDEGGIEEIIASISVDHIPEETQNSDIDLELFDKVGVEGFVHCGTPLIKESDVSFDAAINEGYNSEVVDAVTTDHIQEDVHHEKMKVEQHDEVHMESFNHCGRPLIKEAEISINEATLDEGGIEEIIETISVNHIPEQTYNSDIELELFDKVGLEGFIHRGTPLIKESDISFDAAINEGCNSEVVDYVATDYIQEEVHHEEMKVEQHDEFHMESFHVAPLSFPREPLWKTSDQRS